MIATAAQTIGPFFRAGMDRPAWSDLTRNGAVGEVVRIEGVVRDGDGVAVPDAMIEIWQPDGDGRFGAEPFVGFGRACTDIDGRYAFRTVRPGSVAAGDAPFIAMSVFARGLLKRLVTRVYFDDCATANAGDPVLTAIADPLRRATLVAVRRQTSGNTPVYRFDLRLQGVGETVFFAL